jgi:hypothetical protein
MADKIYFVTNLARARVGARRLGPASARLKSYSARRAGRRCDIKLRQTVSALDAMSRARWVSFSWRASASAHSQFSVGLMTLRSCRMTSTPNAFPADKRRRNQSVAAKLRALPVACNPNPAKLLVM